MGREVPGYYPRPSALRDAFDAATIDSGVYEAARYQLFGPSGKVDPAFDATATAVREGYQPHLSYLAEARNEAEYGWMVENLERKLAYRQRQAASGRFIAPMLGAMLAPENALSMVLAPLSGGASLLAGVGRGALIAGLTEVPAEVLRQQFDPTATAQEGLLRVGASTLFAGTLGGFGGYLRGRNIEDSLAREAAIARGTAQTSERVAAPDGIEVPVRDRIEPRDETVVTDPVDGGVDVSAGRILQEFEEKRWREHGLDDALFPTPESWREWVIRHEAAQEAAARQAGPDEAYTGVVAGLRSWLDQMGLSDVGLRLHEDGWNDAVEVTGISRDALGVTFRGRDGTVTIAINPKILEVDPNAPKDRYGRTAEDPNRITAAAVAQHEVVHALRRLGVIRDDEWAALVRRAQRQIGAAEIEQRYRDRSPAQIEEELVAEMFRTDRVGDTVMDRVRRFYESIVQMLRGQGFANAEGVMLDIERGIVGRRQRAARMEGQAAAMLPPTSALRAALEGRRTSNGWRALATFVDPKGRITQGDFFRRTPEDAMGDLTTPLPEPQMRGSRPFQPGQRQARWDSASAERRDWIEGHRAPETRTAVRKRLENSPPARLFAQVFKESPLQGIERDSVRLLGALGVLRPEDGEALLHLGRRLGIENVSVRGRDVLEETSSRIGRAQTHGDLGQMAGALRWLASERGQRAMAENRVPVRALEAASRIEAFSEKWFAELMHMGVRSVDDMIDAALRGRLAPALLSGGVIDIEPKVAQAVPRRAAIPGPATREAPAPRGADGERSWGTPEDRIRREQAKARAAAYEAAAQRALDEARAAAGRGDDPIASLMKARKEQMRQWLRERVGKTDGEPVTRGVLHAYTTMFDRLVRQDFPGWEPMPDAPWTGALARGRRRVAGEMTEADFRGQRSTDEALMDLAGAKDGRGPITGFDPAAAEMRMPGAAAAATQAYRQWQQANKGALRAAMADAVETMANTPFKRVMKTALSGSVTGLMQRLTDDGSMMHRLAMMGDRRSPSVFMNAAEWSNGLPSALVRASEGIYVRYLGKTSQRVLGVETRFATSRGADLGMRRADGSPAMSFEDMNRTAARLRLSGKQASTIEHGEAAPFINEMIQEITGFYEAFRIEGERTGLLGGLDAPQKIAATLNSLRADKSVFENALKGQLSPLLRTQFGLNLQRVDTMIANLEAVQTRLSAPEEFAYHTRIYNVRAMLDHPDAVIPILARALADQVNADPAAVVQATAQSMMAEARKVYKHITEGRADSDFYNELSGTPNFSWARKLTHLKNEWMVDVDVNGQRIDFIETDPLTVGAMYAQRMGPHLAFTREFKGSYANASIGFERRLIEAMADEAEAFGRVLRVAPPQFGPNVTPEERLAGWVAAVGMRKHNDLSIDDHLARIERDIRIDKDRMLGRAVSEPDRWDNRTTGVLKSATHMAVLGFAGWNSIVETGKLIFSHGLAATFPAAVKALHPAGRMVTQAAEMEAIRAGAIPEVALGALSRLAEFGTDPIHMSRAETLLHRFTNRYFMANLLGPVTHGLKTLDSLIRISEMGDALMAADAGNASAEQLAKLQRYGITPAMQRSIANQMRTHGSITDGFWVANTGAWTDGTAVQVFRAALARGVNNTIITASLADRPAVFDGILHFRKGNRSLDALAGANDWTDVGGYWRVQSGLASLPFMYWAYGMAALNKITAPAIRMGTPRQIGGIVAMMGMAYLAETGRVAMQGEKAMAAWERMDASDRFYRVLDRSGATGMMMDWLYTARATGEALDLPGAVAPFDAIGMGPKYNRPGTMGSALGDASGPAIEVMGGAVAGAYRMLRGDMSGARDVGYALPGQNLPLLGEFHDALIGALEA